MAIDLAKMIRSDDLLATIRGEIEGRLSELRPLLAEHEELLQAEAALVGPDETEPRARAPKTLRQSRKPKAERQSRGSQAAARSRGAARKPGAPRASARERAARRDGTEEAILAALQHGSHTSGELVMVTALSAQSIRRSVGRLERAGAIGRTKREGRTAYVLSSASE